MMGLSWSRFLAVIVKEAIQLRRDRWTFALTIGVPLMQLVLFGFAINSDPKHLPAAIHLTENGPFTRALVTGLRNSGYFDMVRVVESEAEADRLLARGEVQFAIMMPVGFERALVRGERPVIEVDVDATDPVAAGNALGSLSQLSATLFDPVLTGPLQELKGEEGPVQFSIHRRYNPEGLTEYNIVPGLMGVVLSMTMVMTTALAVTREIERGTMENLMAMPLRPIEVMVGKIVPFIAMGYIQVLVILAASKFLFAVPMLGSLFLLSWTVLIFIADNLAVGYTFSTVAENQLQALQSSFFYFLPSILLSGFMFPFRGMPVWAQWIGQIFPLTHFLRIVRGILLKGNGFAECWPDIWPMILFLAVTTTIALKRYRMSLD